MKYWKEIPNLKYGGRYFESSKDYKEDMIERSNRRRIRSSHINRTLSDYEKKSIIPFVEKYLYYEKDSYCTSHDLYPYYEDFCRDNGLVPLRNSIFSTCIKVYVFLQENIPGILFSRAEINININLVGYYNLGVKRSN